jgi:hypothetical protein
MPYPGLDDFDDFRFPIDVVTPTNGDVAEEDGAASTHVDGMTRGQCALVVHADAIERDDGASVTHVDATTCDVAAMRRMPMPRHARTSRLVQRRRDRTKFHSGSR